MAVDAADADADADASAAAAGPSAAAAPPPTAAQRAAAAEAASLAASRAAFAAVPESAVRALVRLLPQAEVSDADASLVKVVLQGLTIVTPGHWAHVADELRAAMAALGAQAEAALQVRAAAARSCGGLGLLVCV
jgi:hypothetical protein